MKRWTCSVLALCLFTSTALRSQDKKDSFEVEIVKNIPYLDSPDADSEKHRLDLYLPKDKSNYPVLLFIHGGGWTKGSKNSFSSHGKMLASQGIGFVAINYRLSPAVKHPAHIEDVAQAFSWAHKQLAKRGANVKQIFVSGHSAGGHLAALLATDESYLKALGLSLKDIKGVIPISGVFQVRGIRSEIFGEDEAAQKASPLTHVRPNLPPFLVLYAEKELGALGKQAEAFGKALTKVKGVVTVKMISDRDHGSIMRQAAKPDDAVAREIVAFIRRHLADKPAE